VHREKTMKTLTIGAPFQEGRNQFQHFCSEKLETFLSGSASILNGEEKIVA